MLTALPTFEAVLLGGWGVTRSTIGEKALTDQRNANHAKIKWAEDFLQKCKAEFDSEEVEQHPSSAVPNAVLDDKSEITTKAVL